VLIYTLIYSDSQKYSEAYAEIHVSVATLLPLSTYYNYGGQK